MGVWLTGAAIHAMGDRYDGVIASVKEQEIRNRWTTRTSVEDVIVFDDGKQLVLSHAARLELIAGFGSDSDDWIGRPLSLGTRRVERRGEPCWERFLFPADVDRSGSEGHETERPDAVEFLADGDDDRRDDDPDLALPAYRLGRRH